VVRNLIETYNLVNHLKKSIILRISSQIIQETLIK